VAITHPDSGRKALFVNPAFTIGIEGWTREESAALLQYRYSRAIQPENVARVEWHPGSVAIWDNRATQHRAVDDYDGQARLMHRVTLMGDVPVDVRGERSRVVSGTPLEAIAS